MRPCNKEVIVIGAGIVGVCCGRWLQRDGHSVHIIDRVPPGHSCSWGNAGVLALDSVIPQANPHTLRALPRMLCDRHGPVRVRNRDLPSLLPWLVRFLANGREALMKRNTAALTELLSQAEAGLLPLIQGRSAEELLCRTGSLVAFETAAAFEEARWEIDLCKRQGIECEVIDSKTAHDHVPQLGQHVVGGFHFPNNAMIIDPGGFVECLADDFRASNGTIERENVEYLEQTKTGIRVTTESGVLDAEHLVIAAGAWTNRLAHSLGDHFPLATERGYHAMIENPGISTSMPVMSGEHMFITTPMQHGLRMAGTTELGGLDKPPESARVRQIVDWGQQLFPNLEAEQWIEWLGFRPTLPDSLPVIGRSPSASASAVSYAFGHQHVGLTLGGITGRLVADDLAGRKPVIDMHPLRATRF